MDRTDRTDQHRILGRFVPTHDETTFDHIRRLLGDDLSTREVAALTGVSQSTVARYKLNRRR